MTPSDLERLEELVDRFADETKELSKSVREQGRETRSDLREIDERLNGVISQLQILGNELSGVKLSSGLAAGEILRLSEQADRWDTTTQRVDQAAAWGTRLRSSIRPGAQLALLLAAGGGAWEVLKHLIG